MTTLARSLFAASLLGLLITVAGCSGDANAPVAPADSEAPPAFSGAPDEGTSAMPAPSATAD